MANQKTLLVAALAILALVCGCASASVSASETEVHHRVRRFSIEGIVTCLAMIEFGGFPELITEIEKDCQPLGEGLRYRLCVLRKVSKLGPEYVECVLQS